MKLDRIIAVRSSKTVYRDGSDCVKVFDSDYSKAEILREALYQALAEETGLRVPAIRAVEQFDGRWAIVSEFIKGKTLSQLMREHPEKRTEHIALLASIHNGVHEKTCKKLGSLYDRLYASIARAGLDGGVTGALIERLNTLASCDTLYHGDFVPANILVSADGEPYILDWSRAARGDAAMDAAQTYLHLLVTGGGAEEYLELYTKSSGIVKERIEELLPVAAAVRYRVALKSERELLDKILDGAVEVRM